MEKIKEIFNRKILVIDGAMGTMVQSYKLEEVDFRGSRFKDHEIDIKGNNDILKINGEPKGKTQDSRVYSWHEVPSDDDMDDIKAIAKFVDDPFFL